MPRFIRSFSRKGRAPYFVSFDPMPLVTPSLPPLIQGWFLGVLDKHHGVDSDYVMPGDLLLDPSHDDGASMATDGDGP